MRALIAARKSTKAADNQEGASLDTQDTLAREFAERMDWTVAGLARDTVSGRKAPVDRKELGDWLKNRLGEFDCVLAYKSDRLSRGTDEDWSRIEAWASDHKKVLVVVDGSTGVRYPARDDSDYWQWTAMKRQASKEWDAIRERALRSQARSREVGSYATNPPFGYKVEGPYQHKRLVPVEELRPVVVEIFNMAIDGKSTKEIAGKLGLPNAMFAQRVINRWVYAGRVEGKHGVYAECEAIVSSDVVARAQAAKRSRDLKARGGRPALSDTPPLLVCRCPKHASPMYARAGKYRCQRHFGVPCEVVDAFVIKAAYSSKERERKLTLVAPGSANEGEIALLKRDRLAALERDDLALVGTLTAALKALQSAPKVEDTWEWVETGRSVGEALRELSRGDLKLALKDWQIVLFPEGKMRAIPPWKTSGGKVVPASKVKAARAQGA